MTLKKDYLEKEIARLEVRNKKMNDFANKIHFVLHSLGANASQTPLFKIFNFEDFLVKNYNLRIRNGIEYSSELTMYWVQDDYNKIFEVTRGLVTQNHYIYNSQSVFGFYNKVPHGIAVIKPFKKNTAVYLRENHLSTITIVEENLITKTTQESTIDLHFSGRSDIRVLFRERKVVVIGPNAMYEVDLQTKSFSKLMDVEPSSTVFCVKRVPSYNGFKNYIAFGKNKFIFKEFIEYEYDISSKVSEFKEIIEAIVEGDKVRFICNTSYQCQDVIFDVVTKTIVTERNKHYYSIPIERDIDIYGVDMLDRSCDLGDYTIVYSQKKGVSIYSHKDKKWAEVSTYSFMRSLKCDNVNAIHTIALFNEQVEIKYESPLCNICTTPKNEMIKYLKTLTYSGIHY